MAKILNFFKRNWKFCLIFFFAIAIFWQKIEDFFEKVFDRTTDESSSDYLGQMIVPEQRGVIVGDDGLEYFRYGDKKVRLTEGNKAVVANYVNVLFEYISNNTCDLYTWIFNDETHFYTGEIQAVLNQYCSWCESRKTWYHYFAYVWKTLHTINFLDYLRANMNAEGYEATTKNVADLPNFYY